MEDGIRDGGSVGFEGLEDQQEPFFVSGDEGGEGGDFLERGVLVEFRAR